MDLSGELSSLNIGSNNESNNEEKDEASNTVATNNVTLCANCGKHGDRDNMNTCNNCDLVVYYCNVSCKKKHRSKHKKKCKKWAAELHDAQLFKEHPREECPICMLPLPLYDTHTGMTFHSCCGKNICNGCVDTMEESGVEDLCPFCRTPCPTSDEEEIKRTKKLMEKGDADAFCQLGGYYVDGVGDIPQDRAKACELYLKAGQLGCAVANFNLGIRYTTGDGVEVDERKAMHYWELAAMNGHIKARHNLGCKELEAGNYQQAFKHLVLAASAGYKDSLYLVKGGYMAGHVTKEQYANTLREYQKSQDEMKSDARDKAWAARNVRMGG